MGTRVDRHTAALLWRRDRLPARVNELVEGKLGRLLRHAATTVSWYRRLCAESGIDPERVDARSLQTFPITRKGHWRDRLGSEFLSTAVPLSRGRWIRSSGTTGASIAMPIAFADRVARRIGTQRCFWAAGVGVWDRYAWIRATQHAVVPRPLHERFHVLRTLYLDVRTPPDSYWPSLVAWAPQAALGFPLEMESVAAWVEQGRVPRLPRPLVCGAYGEPVEGRTRTRIEAALGPVREIYGSAEAGTIAWECGRGPGLHVNADMVIVEFARDGRPVPAGAPGEVVVTNLHSWAMPVIRYAQDDVGWAVPGPCPCGRPGPLMRVESRFRMGPLLLPSGRRVAARFFVQALPSPGWLLDWRVDQPAPDRLHLRLRANRAVPDEEIRAIAEGIARACWEPVQVVVEVER